MICLLTKFESTEKEFYWKLGDGPLVNAEKVIGLQANNEELNFIITNILKKYNFQKVNSWFGIEAKKIAILIGAAS